MSMLEHFKKFTGFKVLEYFLLHPTCEIHLKELARALKISSGSAKLYCDLFESEGILLSRRKGNLRLFRLNNDDFAVKEIKKTYYLLLLKEKGIQNICKNCSSLAIYGSFASGEFDEKSDLDILVIGSKEDIDYKLLREIEERVGVSLQLTVLPFYKWEKMKEEKDHFAESVIRKHVLIKGAPL
ncbi:nucleotidyltransferase domain-containing protein [Thermococcus argininiproducens]|uniref:protein adenylyltransferase n=1 Tax=Thermococcus argininiproducens TaxID=2866384 RepID=A0A9E7SCV3_9EURY|nr:nucleotidyltransferase domain-containing protein [Thermococcus argininiproducens]USH00474.1 nucleotidyltransferase domain-containing protein [Thermococcus argininiproducens]